MMTHDGDSRTDAVVGPIDLSTAMRPYPAYKDSGVNRLGRVPDHWEVRRLKHSLGINVAVLPEDTEPDYEFRYIDIGCVGTGELISDPRPMRFETAPSRARRVVGRGDTLVSTVRTYLKAVWHAEEDIRHLVASTGFAVLTPRPWVLPKFVGYACRSEPFTDHVTAEAVGVVYPAIAETRLASALRLCIPPLPEQRAIVRFLDHTDRRIRRYILAKERLIELLEEQTQAIIHEAVTGQIDVRTGQPYSAYKGSGVEWLGEVPEHWEVGRVKHLVAAPSGGIQMGPFGASLKDLRDENTGYKLYGQENTISGDFQRGSRWITEEQFEELRRYELLPDDVVLTRKGSIGKCRLIPHGLKRGIMDSDTIRVRLNPDLVDHQFLVFILHLATYLRWQIKSVQRGAVLGGLNTSTIANLRLALPPIAEQQQIAAMIGSLVGRVRSATDAVRRQIQYLGEYRTRLIADVVTGKQDVREVGASLPSIDPLGSNNNPGEPEQTSPLIWRRPTPPPTQPTHDH